MADAWGIGTGRGTLGQPVPIRDQWGVTPQQPLTPQQQGKFGVPNAPAQPQAQPQQANPWQQPIQQNGQQQNAGQQGQNFGQPQGAPAGPWSTDVGDGRRIVYHPDGTATYTNTMYDDPQTQAAYEHVKGLYDQGNDTVSDFLNGLNGGGRGGQGGGITPNMGGLLPAGFNDPNAAGGTGLGGTAGGWGGWGTSPNVPNNGLGDWQMPDVLGGLNLPGMDTIGQYGGQDNTVGLALSAMLMGQVPPPGQEMMPTPGNRNYTSGITGGQMDPGQLEAIQASLGGNPTMPNIPGMTGGEMGALGDIWGSAGGSAMANQRNAYDLMAANSNNTLANNKMQAQADAGLAGQQFGINRELQDLRRFNTQANQDNGLQQSAIQMLMSALGGF